MTKFTKFFIALALISLNAGMNAQNVVKQDSVKIMDNNLESAKKPVVLSNKALLTEMRINNPAMYSQYRSGKKMQRTGIIMTGIGGGIFVMGALFSIILDFEGGEVSVNSFVISRGDNSGLQTAGNVLMTAGSVCLLAGLPVMIIGGQKKKQTFQDFKNQYYSKQQSSYFQMTVYPNRIGIAYVF